MLSLPTSGFSRSVAVDNVSLLAMCEWIEGSLLFDTDAINQRDVVDILSEHGIYEDQDMAQTKVSDVWSELRKRIRTLGKSSPFTIEGMLAGRSVNSWQEAPAYSFCLTLSLSMIYSGWSRAFSPDYNEQGEIFELLSTEAFQKHFTGWSVHSTGWKRTQPVRLPELINDLAGRLGEAAGNLERWTEGDEHEAELDLLCYKPFLDNRPAQPVFLIQCASGANWTKKLGAPNLSRWGKLIDFAAPGLPRKGFTIPYLLSDGEHMRRANQLNGLLFDRLRLLSLPDESPDWVSKSLRDRIVPWCKQRLEPLQSMQT